jgi:uncharacterized protein (TIGR00661 family)
VAPLDWGLGHATRCIPVIKALLEKGYEVWLAGEGMQKKLLENEFPALPFLDLKGYRVRYSRSANGTLLKIILQLPRILACIRQEHRWLKKIMAEHGFKIIISDNRYGLYHPGADCIFIGHQLSIRTGKKNLGKKFVQRIQYSFIEHFKLCWVPDHKGPENLGGELSHPARLPAIPVTYLGPLSRFSKKFIPEKKDHLLIVLSGPEPQRSWFEEKIIEDISHYPGTATIVRGLPGERSIIPSTNMINFYNHLDAETLNMEMEKASWVIARSGYSTIMDIAALKKKSILIPTPGQTEQLYLAEYLFSKQLAFRISQKEFSLEKALRDAENFSYKSFQEKPGALDAAVNALMRTS